MFQVERHLGACLLERDRDLPQNRLGDPRRTTRPSGSFCLTVSVSVPGRRIQAFGATCRWGPPREAALLVRAGRRTTGAGISDDPSTVQAREVPTRMNAMATRRRTVTESSLRSGLEARDSGPGPGGAISKLRIA
jgi:hypothetical protein